MKYTQLFTFMALIACMGSGVEAESVCFCAEFPDYVSYGRVGRLPDGWRLTDQQFDPDQVWHTFYLALPTCCPDEVEAELWRRSDPNSEFYGQWLSQEELFDLVRDEEAVEHVVEWLNGTGVTDIHEYGDNLVVNATLTQIGQLFNCTVYQFLHGTSGRLHYAVWNGELQVPFWISPWLEMVGGLLEFPRMSGRGVKWSNRWRGSGVDVEGGDPWVTPYGLRKMYNVTTGLNWNHSCSQAVAEFTGMTCVTNSDLALFLNASGLAHYQMTDSHMLGDKCDLNVSYPGTESSLDIQYQMAFQNSPDQFYLNVDEWLYEMTVELSAMESPPLVISMSYGWNEAQQCDPSVFGQCYWNAPPEEYTRRVNLEFAKLGLRGVTLVASSGDSGPNGRSNMGCSANASDPDPFRPVFPTDSPYVLSVGGNIVVEPVLANQSDPELPPACQNASCVVGGEERNCDYDRCMWTAGGGFSNYFEMPWWQYTAVQQYLNGSTVKPHAYFNQEGRAYPDVSLVAHNYMVWIGGYSSGVDGTSASSPAFSAMVTLLNNLRASQGRGSVGMIGPLLYNCTSCFTDITVGHSNSTEEGDCQYGYNAGVGYDPVYGLGTPNFGLLYEYVRDLPN